MTSPRTFTSTFIGGACCLLLTSLSACSSEDSGGTSAEAEDGGDGATGTPGFTPAAREDLVASGVGKYLGKNTPRSETTTGNETEYFFDSANDGPVCFQGSEYTVHTRDQGSENLMIYLEGGGACWTGFCAAKVDTTHAIPKTGIADPNATTNVVADWNVVYVPYCDGSAFLGDNEVADASVPGGTRKHFGIRNLTAAIEVAKTKFPNPKRILLAGSSAGGYGTITGTGIVRLVYPTTELMVFNDAGLGLDNRADAASQLRKDEWKFLQFVPSTCAGCLEDASKVVGWGLANDPTLRVSAFSSFEDLVIGPTFLKLAGPDFKALLIATTDATHAAFPDRFKRFFIEGTEHTTLIANESMAPSLHGYLTKEDGVSVSDWTAAFVNGTAEWTDRVPGGN